MKLSSVRRSVAVGDSSLEWSGVAAEVAVLSHSWSAEEPVEALTESKQGRKEGGNEGEKDKH